MFIAIDDAGQRIPAVDAEKGKEYFCPVCKQKVVLKAGEIKEAHFAHISSDCSDNWHYDMSEWHQKMQSYFSEEYREIVVSYNGVTHRADILKDGVVIEFQHSPISAAEFCARNDFYTALGFRVVWVFDVTEQIQNQQLSFTDRDDDRLFMKWNYPKQVLQYAPSPTSKPGNIVIWLTWDDEYEPDSLPYMYRVIWEVEGYKRLLLSDNTIQMEKDIDVNPFFWSDYEWVWNYVDEFRPFKKLQIKIKGGERWQYICPRNNKWLRLGSEGCSYCKHCIAIEKRRNMGWYVYCKYPSVARNTPGGHPGNECAGAPYFLT